MRGLSAVALSALLLSFAGCTSRERTPEQLQEQTARATAKIKQDTVAVAKGVKQGLTKPSMVDLNSASKSDLSDLPGIDDATAARIIAARPYANTDQLVTKRAVTNAQYDQIKDRVTVRK